MKKKILFWGISCAFLFLGYTQEPLQCQDAIIALDENGETTITSSDVLINTSGELIGLSGNSILNTFIYSMNDNNLAFNASSEVCVISSNIDFNLDRNPLNNKSYLSFKALDIGTFFNLLNENLTDCNFDESFFGLTTGDDFSFSVPYVFTFDKDGILYISDNTSDGISIFNINTNEIIPFADFFIDKNITGMTYDFENDRLLITNGNTSNQTLTAIDITTATIETLFTFTPPIGCDAKALEYIGNNILIAGGGFNSACNEIYTINIENQEINSLLTNTGIFNDFLFIENEIETATLSTTVFTCDNLGENTIEVTQLIDGNPVTCEVTVTILSTFEFTNCPIYRQLAIDPDTGMGIIPNLNQNINLISSCSSDFTITQDISSGTLVDAGENIVVTLTATDELGQTAQCFVTVSTDPILNTDDIVLDKNITLFPNPTKGNITLQNENNLPLSEVIIYNSIGQIVYTQQIDNTTTDMRISLENYPDGIYFVRINSGNTSVVKRIIKQ